MTMAPAWVEALVGALLLASGIASVLAGLGLVGWIGARRARKAS